MTKTITLRYLVTKTVAQVAALTSSAYLFMALAEMHGATHFDSIVVR